MVQSVVRQQHQADGPLWPEDHEVGGDDAAGKAAEAAYYAELAVIEEVATYDEQRARLAEEAGGDWEDCRQCHGRGWAYDSDPSGEMAVRWQCGVCRGTGLGDWVDAAPARDMLLREVTRPLSSRAA